MTGPDRVSAQGAPEQAQFDPVAGLHTDTPVALLPVRLETRFVTEAAGALLLVRVYPDEVHIDDHQRELTPPELAAASGYWTRVWRAGLTAVAAERAAFVELCGRVGVTRGLWVVHATQPDEATRPADPVPDGIPLPTDPVLANIPVEDTGFSRAAMTRVLPDRWVVLGYRGSAQVVRELGNPIPDPLPVGPAPDRAPPADPDGPPLEDDVRWLVDFDAAVAVGMGIRVPLTSGFGTSAGIGFDRVVVLGVRAAEDPEASAARLRGLFDVQRYTSGLGFVPVGSSTNNTADGRSAWSRRPEAGAAFDDDRDRTADPDNNAALVGAALGIGADSTAGAAYATAAHLRGTRDLQVALWPATIGYFLDVLLSPVVDDSVVQAVNELFVETLRGLGPLPSLRVGSQPYGLLPAMSMARWQPTPADPARQDRLVELIRMLTPEWLAATMPAAARAVPHVGSAASATSPDQEMLDILARDALAGSYRLRPVRGRLTSRGIAPMMADLDAAGLQLADATHRLVGGAADLPGLAGFQFDPRTARIRRDVVLSGALSEVDPVPAAEGTDANYLAFLARRGERTAPFSGPGSSSLLFALARLACLLADADAAVRITRPASRAAARAALEPELIDPVPGRVSRTGPRLLAMPASEVVAAQLPAGQSVGDFLAEATEAQVTQLGLPHVTDAFRHTTEVRRALGRLATIPSAELDRLVRAVLDVCSHRLDAWVTSFATRRLADVRKTQPAGIHLGGYGWVENLRPAPPPQPATSLPPGEPGPLFTDPANAGHVAAPSLTQASAAALLLSGHLSHRGSEGVAEGAFAVDLSSERVRLASWLLDGVRQGQPLGALLGYRFERGLHDRSRVGLELDQFIRPFRALAPLVAGRTEDVEATVEAIEAVAASAVVDGLTLLTHFQEDPTMAEPALLGANPEQRNAILAELTALGDAADALADLLTAETTYQLASGNIVRAAASLDALGSGLTQPPEPEVTQTPRPGFAYSHRLVVLAPTDVAPPAGWGTGADRPRRLAEPRLDAWFGDLLGPADLVRAAVRLVGPDGGLLGIREVTLAQLGVCALDLVYGADAAPETQVELDVIDQVAATAEPGVQVELVHRSDADWPGMQWPPDVAALDDALAQGRWVHDAVGSARSLTANDLTGTGSGTASGVHRDELRSRVSAVSVRYVAAVEELQQARDALDGEPDSITTPAALARVQAALSVLARFGITRPRPSKGPAETPEPPDPRAEDPLVAQVRAAQASADGALAEARRVIEQVDRLMQGPSDEPPPGPPLVSQLPEILALQAVFGASFAVLPLIETPGQPWTDALAGGALPEFLDSDAAAPLAWLQRVGRTRAAVERYLLAVTGGLGRLSVAQTPIGPRWVGLPTVEGEEQLAAATSILFQANGAAASAPTLAGLVIDEWTDVVPARETTAGVAFNFNEPGARAPQAVILAVTPAMGEPWTLDSLADIVTETADLARIRMVGPEEAPWLGRYLPALYVADNPLGDTLTVDLGGLVAQASTEDS